MSARFSDHDKMEAHGFKVPGFRFDGSGKSFQSASVEGTKGIPKCLRDQKYDNNLQGPCSAGRCMWPRCSESKQSDGAKQGGDWFNADACANGAMAKFGSKSPARKAASATIVKIPLPRHIAAYWKPNATS